MSNFTYDPSVYDGKHTVLEQLEQTKTYLKQANALIDETTRLATSADAKANQAVSTANEAKTTAEQATVTANDASSAASQALNIIHQGSVLDYVPAEALAEKIEGSETVVVDVNEAGDSVEIHLDASVVADLSKSVKTPVSTPSVDEVPVLKNNGAVEWTPVTEVGGGKLYLHKINFNSASQTYIKFLSPVSRKFWTDYSAEGGPIFLNLAPDLPIFGAYYHSITGNPDGYTTHGIVYMDSIDNTEVTIAMFRRDKGAPPAPTLYGQNLNWTSVAADYTITEYDGGAY